MFKKKSIYYIFKDTIPQKKFINNSIILNVMVTFFNIAFEC